MCAFPYQREHIENNEKIIIQYESNPATVSTEEQIDVQYFHSSHTVIITITNRTQLIYLCERSAQIEQLIPVLKK